jgi:hypothetical protein
VYQVGRGGLPRAPSPTVHTELREFLAEHGHHGGLGWFLDALGFTIANRDVLDNNLGDAPQSEANSPVPSQASPQGSIRFPQRRAQARR